MPAACATTSSRMPARHASSASVLAHGQMPSAFIHQLTSSLLQLQKRQVMAAQITPIPSCAEDRPARLVPAAFTTAI